MKLYNQQDAEETLSGILSIQPARLLASELAKLMVKYADKNNGWTIKNLDIVLSKQENKFSILINGEE
jgi:histone H3/H4